MNYRKIFNQVFVNIFVSAIFLSIFYVGQASAYQYSSLESPGDVAQGSIIPCTNKCEFNDVFRLLNNLIEFFIKELLIPLFVIMIMYAGFKYITARGNSSKVANLKSMFGNMLMGLILMLCSWLIVKGILYALGYTEGLAFFE